MRRRELAGHHFGRLTVIAQGKKLHGKTQWQCLCECGRKILVTTSNLQSGNTKSCGCLHREMVAERTRTRSIKHGHWTKGQASPTYRSWLAMHGRCKHSYVNGFEYYGGRGIVVCERWVNFENFLADMGERPPGHSLDRIDANGNYEPANCRWATVKEQLHNRRPRNEWSKST